MTVQTIALLALWMSAPSKIDEGRLLFHDPGLGANGVSCAQCHSTVEDETKDGDGLIRAGHSLFGAHGRKYWRGDIKKKQHGNVAQAAEVCIKLFQGGEPLEPRQRVVLTAYLRSLGKGRHPPLQIHPALEANGDYERSKYLEGDADRGKRLFYQTCHSCHPHGRAGLGKSLQDKRIGEIIAKIREGNGLLRGASPKGRWMPFFGKDRLSDAQVADIAAYVYTFRQ